MPIVSMAAASRRCICATDTDWVDERAERGSLDKERWRDDDMLRAKLVVLEYKTPPIPQLGSGRLRPDEGP